MKNLFQYPGLKILSVFLKEPYREFYLREVAGHAGVSVSTVKTYLDSLVRDEFLVKSRRANLTLFKANIENPMFRHFKIAYFLRETKSLIKHLRRNFENCSVILYGSCARGEDDRYSDIDLLIVGGAEKVELTVFEKRLDREITLMIFTPQQWEEKARVDEAFYENIITEGLVINGNVPVIKK